MRLSVVEWDWGCGPQAFGSSDGTETTRRGVRFGVLQNEAEV
jgi:hypothetical protein